MRPMTFIDTQMRILRIMSDNPDSKITQILRKTGSAHVKVRSVVEEFVKNGLVTFQTSAFRTGYMKITYRVTSKGFEVLQVYDRLIALLGGKADKPLVTSQLMVSGKKG